MGVPINTILQINLNYTVNSQKCMNVMHYSNSVSSTVQTIDAEYNEILNAITLSGPTTINIPLRFKDLMSEASSLTQLVVQFVSPVRYVGKVQNLIGSNGSVLQPCHAQNLQLSFTKYTALAGRKFRGAFRIGGLPVTAYQDGMIDFNTMQPAVGNFANDMVRSFTTAGGGVWNPGVAKIFPPPNTGQSYITWVTRVIVKDEVRTQRTRTVGRGI